MITGKVSDSPRKAYSGVSDNALSSNFGGASVDGLIFFCEFGSGSTYAYHLFVSMVGAETSNALTSWIALLTSKDKPQ